jgi:DNA polymerase-3 subunit gamma/tau
MGEALYRKYRSRKLDEIVGQEHITSTLNNALKADKISHAYLFTGPRGVGKTSIARILAYEINNLEYGDQTAALDIIEIDAASNRRIDEIRELRDKVHTAPTAAKYKVYIIDEVHMLTKEAFNALLKTLEEPPKHVVFILATTEVHKLPDTIVSRTQRYTFKPIDEQAALSYLQSLAKKEDIVIDDEALRLIIEHSRGSFRDSISMLDQISSVSKEITKEQAQRMIGVPPDHALQTVLKSVLSQDTASTIKSVTELYNSGYQSPMIAKRLSQLLHEQMIDQKEASSEQLSLAKALLAVPASHDPNTALELALLEASLKATIAQNNQLSAIRAVDAVKASDKSLKTKPQPITKQSDESTTKNNEALKAPDIVKPKKEVGDEKLPSDIWEQTLQELRGKHNTLYGIARMATSDVDGQTIVLGFSFPFHYRRCNETRNKQKLSDIATDIAGQSVEIVCELQDKKPTKTTEKKTTKATEPKSDTLESITEVFGGGEVLD